MLIIIICGTKCTQSFVHFFIQLFFGIVLPPSSITFTVDFTDNVDSCQIWVRLHVKHGSENSSLCCSNIQCFLFFPTLQSLLVAVNVVCLWAVPTAFVTTQVKVDLRSSDVTFFNSKLLCRIAPSSKDDLKQRESLQLSSRLDSGCTISHYFI